MTAITDNTATAKTGIGAENGDSPDRTAADALSAARAVLDGLCCIACEKHGAEMAAVCTHDADCHAGGCNISADEVRGALLAIDAALVAESAGTTASKSAIAETNSESSNASTVRHSILDRDAVKLSDTERRAIKALAERNGEGAIVRWGKLLAAGDKLSFEPVTWLRLMTAGMVEGAGRNRIRLTAAGRAEAERS